MKFNEYYSEGDFSDKEVIKNPLHYYISPRLMSAKQAASYLGLHYQTIYTMALGGELPSIKIGKSRKFDKVDLDHWIDGKKGNHV